MQIRVYYEDTDAGGVVYHTNYIKYCERARSELFFAKGKSVSENNCHFVVKSLQANFIKPAKLGDLLTVKTSVLDHKKASLTVRQSIFKEEIELFNADILLAYVCEGRPKRIDEETLQFLLSQ